MITDAAYIGSGNSLVRVQPSDVIMRYNNQDLIDWVAEGNAIQPYEIPLEEEKEIKRRELEDYAQVLIDAEQILTKEELKIRRDIRLDKIAAEVPLTVSEKAEAIEDYEIAEYAVLINKDKDKIVTKLEKLTDKVDIKKLDVTKESWTVKTNKVKGK